MDPKYISVKWGTDGKTICNECKTELATRNVTYVIRHPHSKGFHLTKASVCDDCDPRLIQDYIREGGDPNRTSFRTRSR